MLQHPRSNAALYWYLEDLTYRIVAESGIPSDRHHLGKIIHQSLLDNPDFVLQIDGGVDKKETGGSVHQRSVRCAVALKNFGLKHGDVLCLMGHNHLDLAIPFYAGLFLGVIVDPIDITLGVNELKAMFQKNQPKIVFCQKNESSNISKALTSAGLDTKIVTFDRDGQNLNFSEFLDKYGDDTKKEDFKPTDFDSSKTVALLMMTSGTTGLPKSAATTHKNFISGSAAFWARQHKYPDPKRMSLVLSPLQWLSPMVNYIFSAILRYTRLQSSLPLTQQHIYHLINKYRPSHMICSPPLMTSLVKPEDCDKCDFSSYDSILIGGSNVSKELLEQVKETDSNILRITEFKEIQRQMKPLRELFPST